MTKQEFINLIKNPATINLKLIGDLEEITHRYPYFQNAHILLAKQYHGHENIKFDTYLRKASAYAADREKFFRLIHEPAGEIIHLDKQEVSDLEVALTESNQPPVSDNQIQEISEKEAPHISQTTEEVNREVIPTPEPKSEPVEAMANKSSDSETDPMAIITRRLEELNRKNEAAVTGSGNIRESEKEVSDEKNITIDNGETADEPITPTPGATEHIQDTFIDKEEVPDEIQQRESERTSDESNPSDNEIETGTPIESKQEQPAIKEPENTTHTFREWLKLKSVPVITPEDINSYSINTGDKGSEQKQYPDDNIIDRFIREEPRIVPSRSEFYSAGNMARKSAQENSDLVSETLARVYAQQGNIEKAIETYRKLSLKKPEKSDYFAALIKKLEEESESDS